MDIPLDEIVCSVPYVCSLSKKVRLGLQILPGNGMKRAVVGLVEQVEVDSVLKESLQQKPEPGERIMRQVDIRFVAGGPIEFKMFVCWDWKLGMWHIFVEGAKETVFENGEPNW